MSQSSADQIDWRAKYKSMKKKLKEIKSLRTVAVREDSRNLQAKIDEHRRIHEATKEDIQQQNEDLTQAIQSIQEAKSEIKRLESSIDNLKRSLSLTDSILSVVLNFKSMEVQYIGPGHYQIACVQKYKLVFELEKGKQIKYTPISLPPISSLPDFLMNTIEFGTSQLQGFCNQMEKLLKSNV